MERQIATILAAGVVGYTPLMGNSEAGAFRRGGPNAGGMT